MSVTGSMYTGISGLTSHSQAISVISNNLANTNTVGFKCATTQFEDVFYSSVNTANGLAQVGNGATVSSIYSDFSQGSYESSSSSTDVAIGGNGFFIVDNPVTGDTYYTRAGNFTFDSYGYLVTPAGYRVQGWSASTDDTGVVNTVGALGDLQLESYQSPPQATTLVNMNVNLDKDSDDNSVDTDNPFFAMFDQWDGTDEEPLAESRYEYQSTITVYDEAGTPHELTIYFDPVQDDAVTSDANGNQVWEYIITCDPDDDNRTIDGQSVGSTSAAGLLMSGTLTFNASGEIQGMTAFTLGSGASGDLTDLSNWTTADFSDDGYPILTGNFSGASNASVTSADDALNIAIDFGIANKDIDSGWGTTITSADELGNDYSNLFTVADQEIEGSTCTAYDSASSTMSQGQDGYATGFLQGIEIDTDGVITGIYSNGQSVDLFVLALADFTNEQGLNLEGGNLYSATSESGEASTGRANTSLYGSISPNTLEQSNVDVSTQMVKLIVTQRGYQANSKVITTSDSLLQEAINLKR